MKDQFIYFKEILTGVQNDGQAKIIRVVCLLALLIGTIWSVMSYMNASRLSDTSIEMNIPARAMTSNPQELNKVVALAQSVNDMRTGGERLAAQMSAMNKKLFTTNAIFIPGVETPDGIIALESEAQEEAQPEISVKAVMMTGKNGFAVVNVGSRREHQGLIVRKGYELPENAGRIVNVRADGITVRYRDEDLDYMIK